MYLFKYSIDCKGFDLFTEFVNHGCFVFQGTTQPSTPPVDIHNTRFVTQPKTLSDKKSQFLKALRQEERGDKKGVTIIIIIQSNFLNS